MAERQKEKHQLGRLGENKIAVLVGATTTPHKAPFDIVDFTTGKAYEVKTMSGLSKDLKIHICPSSMERKRAFLKEYGLKAILLAVVVYNEDTVKIYKSTLKKSIRINQMKEVR